MSRLTLLVRVRAAAVEWHRLKSACWCCASAEHGFGEAHEVDWFGSGASESRPPGDRIRVPLRGQRRERERGRLAAAVPLEGSQLSDEGVSVLARHRDVTQEHLLGWCSWTAVIASADDAATRNPGPHPLEQLGHGLARLEDRR